MLSETALDAEARRILDAHAAKVTLTPITTRHPLTMAEAYRIQGAMTAFRLSSGEHIAGWKLGYTSAVMRQQMGVAEPNFGPLTDAMLMVDGCSVPESFTQPRVEPEVALHFGAPVSRNADRPEVLACVSYASAVLEVVDSVWTDYRFKIEDNTADGSSAAGVVLGPQFDVTRIAEIEVRLYCDEVEVGVGYGRDASGHPADGVVWLASRLAEQGLRIEAGQVVITGGLTAAVALEQGSIVRASFDGDTWVGVRRDASAQTWLLH
jgi:2-keto-4-pentenoate hydratase